MAVSPSDVDRMVATTAELCTIPSPTGFTGRIRERLIGLVRSIGYEPAVSRKGAISFCIGGKGSPLLLGAHYDTLGAIVRSIKPNGRLRLSLVGTFAFNQIENENCTVHARDGREFSGTIQLTQASFHVWRDGGKLERNDETIEVVVDERVSSAADVRALGIAPGDFVSFDPRVVVAPSGFLKSRHIDDKAAVAILLELARLAKKGAVVPARETHIVFNDYEEVGHGGASGLPAGIEEIVSVDMGAVGDDLGTDEFKVCICARDNAGPYDHAVTTALVRTAERLGLDHAVAVYPAYFSDATVALKAGHDVRHGLVGPGVYASHGYERTHRDALANTLKLLAGYVALPAAQ